MKTQIKVKGKVVKEKVVRDIWHLRIQQQFPKRIEKSKKIYSRSKFKRGE